MRTAKLAFLLAALTAVRALLPGTGDLASHQGELIFGFFGLQIFAFLIHALPRWIGRPLTPGLLPPLLLTLHVMALVWSIHDPDAAARLRAAALLAGALFLFAHAVRAHAADAALAAGFVLVHALAAILSVAPSLVPLDALHLGLAALILFCLDVSTRIVLALNAVARERNGLSPLAVPPAWLTLAMKASCGLTMVLWAGAGPAGIPALISGTLGLVWLLWLRPLSTMRVVGMAPLFFGLFSMRIGSLLLGASLLGAPAITPSLVIHVWAVGGLAPLAIAISGSIARRQARTAFTFSPLATSAYLAIAIAAALRLAAALLPDQQTGWIAAAQWGWAIAFAASFLFIATSPDRRSELGEGS